MNFANPAWFWALLLLAPLLGLRLWAHLSSGKNLAGLVAPRLHPLLVSQTSQLRHWLSFVFLILGLASLILALARPQLGFEEIGSFSEGRSVILAIDTSRSMLAVDLTPNRLERAKLAARDIVDTLDQDRIGLIAFAGKAFMQAPLTSDHEAVIESIDQIDTEVIPRGGTNLTSAVTLAMNAFRESNSEQKALILFSDGEALEGQGQVKAITEEATREKMVIITIGVGTESGSVIPEPGPDGRPQEGVFVRDERGQAVRSRLDPAALRELATGGGVYIQLGDRASLTRVVKTITGNLEATRREDKAQQRPVERFMWPLGFGVGFLIMSHLVHLLFRPLPRRVAQPARKQVRGAAGFLIFFCFGLTDAAASAQEGWKSLEREDYASALRAFESALTDDKLNERQRTGIHLGIGSAAYKVGDYEKASKAYGKALVRPGKRTREQAHYNLGNTLFRKGELALGSGRESPDTPQAMSPSSRNTEAALRQWLGALEHYEAALKINRNNADAEHNIEVVKKRIEELREQQEKEEQENQEEQQEQEEDQEQENDSQEDQKDSGNDEQEQEQQQPQSDSGEENPPDDQNSDQSGKGDQKNEQDGSGEQQNKGEKSSNRGDQTQNNPAETDPKNDPGDPANEEPAEPPDPGEGELSADGDQTKPAQPSDLRESAARQINPDTGYSPSEARQLIEALADEDGELRPVYPRPFRAERYKNW